MRVKFELNATLVFGSLLKSTVENYMYHECHNKVKPVLRDHCHERPPILTDHAFSAEGPTFQYE